MNDTRKTVFISHSSTDRETALRVAAALRESGVDAVIDVSDVPIGADFVRSMQETLDRADAVVVVVGKDRSPATRREWGEVLRRTWEDDHTPVVPVVLGDAEAPGWMRDRKHITLDIPSDAGIRKIVDLLGDPATAGFRRSAEGERRLEERLVEIRQSARALADAGYDA